MVTPLLLIVMTLMDFIFIITEVILSPIAYLLEYLSGGKIELSETIKKIDETYEFLFMM